MWLKVAVQQAPRGRLLPKRSPVDILCIELMWAAALPLTWRPQEKDKKAVSLMPLLPDMGGAPFVSACLYLVWVTEAIRRINVFFSRQSHQPFYWCACSFDKQPWVCALCIEGALPVSVSFRATAGAWIPPSSTIFILCEDCFYVAVVALIG